VTGYGVRTSQSAPGRGGAKQTAFNYDLIKDHPFGDYGEVTAEQMWDNLEYFLKAVVPVAEEAGVRMAVHPDDPPAQSIGGVARILNSFDGLKRLTQIVDSEYNALDFCQGSMAVQHGDLHEAIRYFGGRNRIVYVHFRNVTGRFPAFSEAFIDEGYVDMAEAVKVYKEVGFDGPVIEDHVPTMIGDDPDKYRARAHAMGYTKALIDAIYGR
jgi:mannonate dehydratase